MQRSSGVLAGNWLIAFNVILIMVIVFSALTHGTLTPVCIPAMIVCETHGTVYAIDEK